MRLSLAISPTNVRNVVGGAWTPAELGASLALWLDADDASTITLNGSTVSQWNDKSGNGNHVSNATAATQPAYLATGWNGQPTVSFTRLGLEFLFKQNVANFSASGDFTIASAFEFFETNNNWDMIAGWRNTANASGGAGGVPILQGMSSASQIGYHNTDLQDTRIKVDVTTRLGKKLATISRSGGTSGNRGAATVTSTGYLQATYDTDAIQSWTSAAATGFQIGGRQQSATGYGDKYISEVIGCNTKLSTEDRQKLEGYLAWKWGIEEDLPIDHPYRFDGSLFGYGLAPNAANYGAGATTAYSLRYVSNTYSNPVVRVREDSGNTEQDFTPVQITDGTLEAFVGAGNNGFVTTWYDQSGNGKNATQTTAVSQPKIVNAGALITENGKPAIVFDGVNDSLITNGYIVELSQNSASVFSAGKFSGSYDLVESDVSDPYSSNFILSGPVGGTAIVWVNAISFGTKDAVNQSSMGFIYNGVNFQAYLNGATSGAAGPATVNPEVGNRTVIGASADFATNFSTSTLQEIIIYRSDESANRSAIELNINQHYGIY